MALGLTQPLTEMSTRNISWGLRRPVRRTDNLTTCHVPIVLKSGSLNFLSRPVMGLIYLSLLTSTIITKYDYEMDSEILYF